MPLVSFRSYCNELEEVIPFNSKEESLSWLQKEKLTNDGITLLVPFKDKNGKIKFLKPNAQEDTNKKLRIIGMANNERERNVWQKLKDCFENYRVPHIGDIDGDVIVPDEPHGFLIVYNKNEHKVGKFFYKIFNILQAKLIAEVKSSPTNSSNLQINIGQLMESLSTVAFGLLKNEEASDFDIKSGRMYFIVNNHLYRYTFRKNPANEVEENYLAAEKKINVVEEVEAFTEKSVNYHRWATFKGYGKAVFLGIVLAVIAGAITFGFLSLSGSIILASIGAAIAGVSLATWTINKGVRQVAKENKDTLDYGKTTFKSLSVSIFKEAKIFWVSSEKKEQASSFSNVKPVFSLMPLSNETALSPTTSNSFSCLNSFTKNKKSWCSCFHFFRKPGLENTKHDQFYNDADLISQPALDRFSASL